jgi:hypothetical protein
VAGEGEIGQAVFFLGSDADVVDDIGSAFFRFLITHDHDVGEVVWDGACHQVAGLKGGVVVGFWEGESGVVAFEIGHEVRDAAVVDVAVGFAQTPDFRVFGEVGLHVLVNELLQVFLDRIAQCADDDIGANSALTRDVAVGIWYGNVCGIVAGGFSNLAAGGVDDLGSCLGVGERGEEEEVNDGAEHMSEERGVKS